MLRKFYCLQAGITFPVQFSGREVLLHIRQVEPGNTAYIRNIPTFPITFRHVTSLPDIPPIDETPEPSIESELPPLPEPSKPTPAPVLHVEQQEPEDLTPVPLDIPFVNIASCSYFDLTRPFPPQYTLIDPNTSLQAVDSSAVLHMPFPAAPLSYAEKDRLSLLCPLSRKV